MLKAVRQRDAGAYRCTAGNSLGKISAAAQIRVLSKRFIVLLNLCLFCFLKLLMVGFSTVNQTDWTFFHRKKKGKVKRIAAAGVLCVSL